MNCREVEPKISAFYDGELAPAERDAITLHLAGCPGCSASLEDCAGIGALLRSDLACEAQPDGVWDRIATTVQETRRTGNFGVLGWPVRAAAVAAGFILYVLGFQAVIASSQPISEGPVTEYVHVEQALHETGTVLADGSSLGGPLPMLDQRPEVRFLTELLGSANP